MADEAPETTRKGYTAPKGRPTRARDAHGGDRRVFGPVAQWITFAIALLVALIIVLMITGGGDFNPLDDESAPLVPPAAEPAAGLPGT